MLFARNINANPHLTMVYNGEVIPVIVGRPIAPIPETRDLYLVEDAFDGYQEDYLPILDEDLDKGDNLILASEAPTEDLAMVEDLMFEQEHAA